MARWFKEGGSGFRLLFFTQLIWHDSWQGGSDKNHAALIEAQETGPFGPESFMPQVLAKLFHPTLWDFLTLSCTPSHKALPPLDRLN